MYLLVNRFDRLSIFVDSLVEALVQLDGQPPSGDLGIGVLQFFPRLFRCLAYRKA
jgi:hypothetical protein